jgi:four helix bundle protein
MPTISSFDELDIWKLARALNARLYHETEHGAITRDFGLRDQIRRASISIMANIAEGFERDSKGEFIRFLRIAKGSAGEVKSHLHAVEDAGYMSHELLDEMRAEVTVIQRKIGSLIKYLVEDQRKQRPATTREPESLYVV